MLVELAKELAPPRYMNARKEEKMEQFTAPAALSLTANPADNWHTWEQSFRRYISASGEKDEKVKIDILLQTIGEDALGVFNTLTVRAEGDEPTMEDVLQAFKDYCSPERNVVFEQKQYWFHQRTSGDTFITELQQKNKYCEISDNDMLTDNLMLSITDCHIKKTVLQEKDLTYTAREQTKTPSQDIKTEHGVQEVPVDSEMKIILPDKSLHHNSSAACPVKCEDEEEKPQTSQIHCKQLPEMNMEEPSACSLNDLIKRETQEFGPKAAQNPHPNCLVLQGSDVTETDLFQSEGSEDDDDEEDSVTDFDAEWKPSKKWISSKKKVQVKQTPEYACGEKASLSVPSNLITHTAEKSVECGVCRKLFAHKASLNQHMVTHSGKTFKCDFCSKNFSHRGSLYRHAKIHTGEKPFQCDICSKCFVIKFDLNTHLRIHTGEKPFQCDICSRRFNRNDHLKSHIKTHTGEKPYKCDSCNKSCFRKSELKAHMRIHTGEKPFECHVCSKCFNRNDNLKLHMKIHTGEKPFKCFVCNKCFIQKIQLTLHMKMHTKENNIQM